MYKWAQDTCSSEAWRCLLISHDMTLVLENDKVRLCFIFVGLAVCMPCLLTVMKGLWGSWFLTTSSWPLWEQWLSPLIFPLITTSLCTKASTSQLHPNVWEAIKWMLLSNFFCLFLCLVVSPKSVIRIKMLQIDIVVGKGLGRMC